MKIPGCSKTFIEQSTFIGNGLYKANTKSILTLRQCGGDGVFWRIGWKQKWLSAWCDASAWMRWLDEKLPHDGLQSSDKELLRLTSIWGWLQVSDELVNAELSALDAPVEAGVLPGWYPALTLNRNEQKLDLFLLDWPSEVLRKFTHGWSVLASASVQPRLSCPLILGWQELTYAQLKTCVPGAVLILPGHLELSGKTCWLLAAETRIKLFIEQGKYIVSEIEQNVEDHIVQSYSPLNSLDDVKITLTFEVGCTSLTFAELASLKLGEVLVTDVSLNNCVKLRANGSVFASGNLLMLGDIPAVRIDKLLLR